MNLPSFEAEDRLNDLTKKLLNADIIYDTVLKATEDVNKAEEAYSNWVCSRVNANKNPKDTVNIDSLNFAAAIAEIFQKGKNEG